MHILLVNHAPIPVFAYGGTERVVWDLGKQLVALGHRVSYLVPAGSHCDFAQVLPLQPNQPWDAQIPADVDVTRFGMVKTNADGRITEFEEKPMVATSNTVSCGIYIIRRRQLIELIERCANEDRYDFVQDILVRYKGLKRIYAYKLNTYWSNIASVDAYYQTNMDFLKPEIRNYFFKQYPDIYSKVDDLPPAKYNVGAKVENSLISSGCIVNGTVEDSVIFKKSFIGNNCYIKNSIILNDVYIGDNTHIENCIVESRDTIRANSFYRGEDEIKIVIEKNDRYII